MTDDRSLVAVASGYIDYPLAITRSFTAAAMAATGR
jgi:hypothetical protein